MNILKAQARSDAFCEDRLARAELADEENDFVSFELAGQLFGQADGLVGRMGEKSRMSQ
jgi:hypothetical protein